MQGPKIYRRIGLAAAGIAGFWAFDEYCYYSTIQRNLKTLAAGIIITIDYKLNFKASKADQIDALHERTAKRILDVCRSNGGLYIKFGQQISTVPILPKPYEIMRQLYDKAPFFEYDVVEQIFKKDFGVLPDEVFASFTREPVASASIAQVHKATLKDGTPVAVKIQKPAIEKQIFWDMLGYRGVIFAFEKIFDLPLYWTADYIEKHLIQETDFLNEVRNSERCYNHIQEVYELKNRVYVPKNYHQYCSKHVMTSEWIDGVPLTDRRGIENLGLSIPHVMTNVVNVFADQLFRVGFVHCDPHPGNILIRRHPTWLGEQIVLLDHGLYVQCSPGFTRQYSLFWKSLFSMDYDLTKTITEGWGIHNPQMFATATLARPWKKGKAMHIEGTKLRDVYESQMEAKKQVVKFLQDTEKIPKELIFVGRNLK
jgi:aarF domain-containing kinase